MDNPANFIMLIVGITQLWSVFVCRSRMVIVPVVIGFGAGYGLFPVISAMVADVCKPEKSTESFSLMYLVQNIGFAVGPAVGGLLFYHHLEGMFWLGTAVCAATVLVLAFFTEDHYDPAQSAAASPALSPDAVTEAIEALIALGYSSTEARNAISQVRDQTDKPEDLIRLALRSMAGF